MTVKRALTKTEITNIKNFLTTHQLTYDEDIVASFYIEINGEIIATGSRSRNIIKCLAVKDEWQGSNLTSKIINELVKSFHDDNIYNYFTITKLTNQEIFLSLGFSKIASTNQTTIFEKGLHLIDDTLNKMRLQIENNIKNQLKNLSIGSVVVNCNPVSNGHVSLIEMAHKNHDLVIVFLVEEDKSYFTYKERMALLFLAVQKFNNIYIINSTNYLVSNITFPNYFFKSMNEKVIEQTLLDATIFNDYFIPIFNISKRYVGTETSDYMQAYNQTLKTLLQDKLVVVPRYLYHNEAVSASKIRKLIKENKINEALELIPIETQGLFKQIIRGKINEQCD